MPKGKSTSRRLASEAGRTLRDPNVPPRDRELAGSDLAQAKPKPKGGKK
jgi:hypothetical protein